MKTFKEHLVGCDLSRLAEITAMSYINEEDGSPETGIKTVKELVIDLLALPDMGIRSDDIIILLNDRCDNEVLPTAYAAEIKDFKNPVRDYSATITDQNLKGKSIKELEKIKSKIKNERPELCSLTFTKPQAMLNMYVPDSIISHFGLEETLSVILYEMTYGGWSLDEIREWYGDTLDSVDSIASGFDPECFMTLEDLETEAADEAEELKPSSEAGYSSSTDDSSPDELIPYIVADAENSAIIAAVSREILGAEG